MNLREKCHKLNHWEGCLRWKWLKKINNFFSEKLGSIIWDQKREIHLKWLTWKRKSAEMLRHIQFFKLYIPFLPGLPWVQGYLHPHRIYWWMAHTQDLSPYPRPALVVSNRQLPTARFNQQHNKIHKDAIGRQKPPKLTALN